MTLKLNNQFCLCQANMTLPCHIHYSFHVTLHYFVSSRQLTEAGSSSAAGSHSKSLDHSHYRPYQGGGGDSGDALSVTSVSSSGSDLEDVNASFLSDSPEGHERKVRKEDVTEAPANIYKNSYVTLNTSKFYWWLCDWIISLSITLWYLNLSWRCLL